MRTASDAMKGGLMANSDFWPADLYTVTLLDGTTYRWTTCDVDLTVNGNTFAHVSPILSRSALRQSARLQVDTLDVQFAGAYQLAGSSVSLLAMNGYFDDARLQLDHLVMPRPRDVSWGVVPSMFEGRIALAEPEPTGVKLTVKSEVELLSRVQLPRFLYSASCMNSVYDANCGLAKAAFTVTGTVTGTPNALSFTSNLTQADGYFNLGVAVFAGNVTPALAGLRRAVASYAHTVGALLLALPLPVAPAPGDTFAVYPGCPKLQSVCLGTFNNLSGFRGAPHIPSTTGGQ